MNAPSRGCAAATAVAPAGASICLMCGFSGALFDSAIHCDQSLRNHSVGRRCRSAASGPRLTAVMRTRMSSAAALRVLHEDVEIAVVLEHAGVEELVLHVVTAPPPIRLHQVGVRIRRLRVLVEVLHVRVRRRAIEVEVVLLHVLAMVAFAVGQPEEPLFENGILAVPEGQAETEVLLVVGNAGDAVFAPAVGARAGMVVREEVPGVAVLAVVLAHGAPLSFTEVRPPLLPGGLQLASLVQSDLFCGHESPLAVPDRLS